ncbi:hypothetical protein [Streptomyces sp. NPDC044948]|uniref:hypothetical protein n=1 Tax=Streptomyces sp. NPDC044948 TaxID=3157092 RepID=UPI0033C9F6AE
MDRAQHLALADEAVTRAERLAGAAERHAYNEREKTPALAAAAAAWADIARTHTNIAALLPDTTTED